MPLANPWLLGLSARFQNDPEATELYEAEDIGEEMICHGPDVGV